MISKTGWGTEGPRSVWRLVDARGKFHVLLIWVGFDLSLEGSLPADVELERGGQAGAGLALAVQLVGQVVVELSERHQRGARGALAPHVPLAGGVCFR